MDTCCPHVFSQNKPHSYQSHSHTLALLFFFCDFLLACFVNVYCVNKAASSQTAREPKLDLVTQSTVESTRYGISQHTGSPWTAGQEPDTMWTYHASTPGTCQMTKQNRINYHFNWSKQSTRCKPQKLLDN
jgi:hypothetical protein